MEDNSFWGGFASKIKIYHIVATFTISAFVLIISFVSSENALSKIEKCTAKVNGIVTQVDKKTEHKTRISNGKRIHYTKTITIAYISVETDNVFTIESISKYTTEFTKGEIVTIHYDPNNPNSYYINDDAEEHEGFAVYGIFFFILGSVLTILYRVNKRQQDFYY
ncbi:MAG: DUF3592 domain-containing protein [Ruminococcus sp.]|uniref:DUF3592 domain-containing protein n=1 Tax=Ruminococcus sp. TaxID=41978 RepID=UPI0025E3BC3F|nr:DUF3592 domain-containing protein [Ruminococcus sp.]MCR5600027.1 DUF3592 domain-containing protein [Ruminococcus sp.]